MAIDTGVLLAAGAGTRLRAAAASKPLCPIGGRTLLDHALAGMAAAGLTRAVVVAGYRAEAIEAHVAQMAPGIVVETVRTPDWRAPNGVSALAAAPLLGGAQAVLAMCDHLVDPAIYARMAAAGAGGGLRLAIDRRLGHAWIDPDDVTRVATSDCRITAIGKGLVVHDAYDAGVFAVGPAFFDTLAQLADPSITEAVRALAARGLADTTDCSDLDWLDVDDPRALALADDWVAAAPH